MASVKHKDGPNTAVGEELGVSTALYVKTDFKPALIHIINQTTKREFWWNQTMADASAWKMSGTGAGTAAAQTFTGSASALNLASPAVSGTGLTAAGQVITTTDNKTMTLNQYAGYWLISATGATPPNLILSNTAVTGAPAVFTVQGAASTDAGAYKVVGVLPVGTNGSSAVTATTTNAELLSSNGITPGSQGFTLGTSIQTTSDVVTWEAWRA